MLIWRKSRNHLLIWMNVVTKITQTMAEFLHIRLEQANLACDINKFSKSPIWKLLYLALLALRAGRCLIEAGGLMLSSPKQHCFQHTSAKKYH